jgi:hypothetical protein
MPFFFEKEILYGAFRYLNLPHVMINYRAHHSVRASAEKKQEGSVGR